MMSWNELTPAEALVIEHKGTERPFTGAFLHHKIQGVYVCRRCEAPLYRSEDKFESFCGWPSFDDEMPGAVRRVMDTDGRRTEIVCANCGGHLGHVFIGEKFTEKNTRHCVNSISMKFYSREEWENIKPAERPSEQAIFASGCFWSKEYFFENLPGVIATRVGYTGGHTENPTYKLVLTKTTGHAEAVEVTFDPTQTSFEKLATLFFEIHDPTIDRRDKGGQYRSAIFYKNEEQKAIAEKLINELKIKGFDVVTNLEPAGTFWQAEARHQKYCDTRGMTPKQGRVVRF